MTSDLRAAAQQALEALESAHGTVTETDWKIDYSKEIAALRAALAEPVQKPVAWTNMPDADDWVFISGSADPNQRLAGKWHPLYTAPPQRKPLTADETMQLINATAGHHWCDEAHLQRFRAAIERAHGIT